MWVTVDRETARHTGPPPASHTRPVRRSDRARPGRHTSLTEHGNGLTLGAVESAHDGDRFPETRRHRAPVRHVLASVGPAKQRPWRAWAGGRSGRAATSGKSRIRSVAAPMKLSSVQVSRKRGWYRVILDSDQVRAEFVGHLLQEVAEFQCATVVRHVSSSLLFILLPGSARSSNAAVNVIVGTRMKAPRRHPGAISSPGSQRVAPRS